MSSGQKPSSRVAISKLKAPFPWFGGKRRVAHLVWERFGDTINYIEPFAGSLAVLLGRPSDWAPPNVRRNETVNDLSCMIANFWRGNAIAPDEVAHWADWPVNEADLHARHRWLHEQMMPKGQGGGGFQNRMHSEPDCFDAKIAGWWVWGISCWIGDGWCRPVLQGSPRLNNVGAGVNRSDLQRRRPALKPAPGSGVHSMRVTEASGTHGKMPYCGRQLGRGVHSTEVRTPQKAPLPKRGGVGVHSQRASSWERGQSSGDGLDSRRPEMKPMGVHAIRPCDDTKRPRLGNGERGVQAMKEPSRQMPQIGGDGGARGMRVHKASLEDEPSGLLAYMRELSTRLRYVRVCCGDWSRITGPSPTTHIGTTAVLLDPPYGAAGRGKVYNCDSLTVAADVRLWCMEHGDDPKLRIALCGYEGEHEELEWIGWDVVAWKAPGGYGARRKANKNAERERIWFSPHCLRPRDERLPLLAAIESGGEA